MQDTKISQSRGGQRLSLVFQQFLDEEEEILEQKRAAAPSAESEETTETLIAAPAVPDERELAA